jgi:hypothetical protein
VRFFRGSSTTVGRIAHIDKFILALGYGGDPVTHFQPSIHLRRAARNGVLYFAPSSGDMAPMPTKAHVNAEILHVGLAEILGVRIVRLSESIEKKLHLLVLVLLVDVAREAIITAPDQLWRGLDRMFAQLFL